MRRIRPYDVLIPAAQIFCVAANTVFLQQDLLPAIALSSYAISYLWTRNVKRMALATEADRHVYSVSCMGGALGGWAFANWLQTII